MEPVLPYSEGEVRSRGLDVVMVLDLSSSMQEEMEPPSMEALAKNIHRKVGKTRLEATKDAMRAFVRARRDDRIGIVVFSDNAYVVSPLTFDHDYLLHYIDMVDEQILQGEGQTAIGDGLALANYLLARQSNGTAGHQVIVLFTDGENNRGRDPLESLADSPAGEHPRALHRRRARAAAPTEAGRPRAAAHDRARRRPLFQRQLRRAI